MSSARPLHELLAGLVGDADAARAHGDPQAYLAVNGHPDLPADLVAEAVVSYADTAPVEVAEHLAPYVTTHSAVPSADPPAEGWFDLLTTAPTEDTDLDPDLAPAGGGDHLGDHDHDHDPGHDPGHGPGPGLDFGSGSTDVLDAPPIPDLDDTPAAPAADHAPAPDPSWTDLEPELDTAPHPADVPVGENTENDTQDDTQDDAQDDIDGDTDPDNTLD